MIDEEDNSADPVFTTFVLFEDLKSEDMQIRMKAIQKLRQVAKAIGPERTRKELLPFLNDVSRDEDEVLVSFSEQLGNFVDCVGGKEYAHMLIPILENLSTAEETAVRNKAVDSLIKVYELFTAEKIKEHVFPSVMRLVNGEWFTSRCSGARLIPTAYNCGDEDCQNKLTDSLINLCGDETPMVRRAAANKVGDLSILMDKEMMIQKMMPVVIKLMRDSVDFVRILGFESTITILKHFKKDDILDLELTKVLKEIFTDKSWRVRYIVATRIVELQESLGAELAKEILAPLISEYLKDVETEVKVAVASQLREFCEKLEKNFCKSFFNIDLYPKICELLNDSATSVRSKVASAALSLSKLIGVELTLEKLDPLLTRIFDDDCSEVRLSAISNLCEFYQLVGGEKLSSSILPAIIKLSTDQKWRVRLAVIEFIPTLASQLGVNFFNQHLSNLCFDWLDDNVNVIREVAAKNIVTLTKNFGEDWAQGFIFSKFTEFESNANYLRRLTAIFLLKNLYLVCQRDDLKYTIMSSLYRMSNDKVANVRFNIAKAFKLFVNSSTAETIEKIKDTLNTLLDDADVDVKYFSQDTLVAYISEQSKA